MSPPDYMSTLSDRPKLRVLVFGASLRADSLNRKLAALAARIAEQNGATVDLAAMNDFEVPSYDGDHEAAEGIPAGAAALRARLQGSDAFIIASPEYNASMPGTLKNLIDWTSRFRPQPFDERHGLLLSASPSLAGGNRGLWASAPGSSSSVSRPALARIASIPRLHEERARALTPAKAASSGKRTTNAVPFSAALSTTTLPRCASAIVAWADV